MEDALPHARYACPCTHTASTDAAVTDDEATFNPHHPRARFSLFPIEQLLYCDDCHQIRCPRCTTEEMMYWLCPSCLFEVPSSSVKSDGNRCTRHCYQCPACSANLSTTAIHSDSSNNHLKVDPSTDSYILQCQYCEWSSLDVDVTLSRPTKITEQLNRLWKQKHNLTSKREGEDSEQAEQEEPGEQGKLHHDAAFAGLQKFYKEELNESGDQVNLYSNSPYSSPANIARIMSLYGGLSLNSLKKARDKPQPMREAGCRAEGLVTYDVDGPADDEAILMRMKNADIDDMSTQKERLTTPSNYDSRFTKDLWPFATRLMVRRGKRCKACRQYLARPDQKVDRLKYKIRLLASNYIQRLSTRPLNTPPSTQSATFRLRPDQPEQNLIQPHKTQQYILTVQNPIFEPVKVTLSTPPTTPGKVASRVTILCPSFAVGQNGDRWEEALSTSTTSTSNDGGRSAAMASLTGASESDRQPEAGKIWSRHWNTTSVILEVVPGVAAHDSSTGPLAENDHAHSQASEDAQVLKIPIHVRVEWEGALHPHEHAQAITAPSDSERKEQRELAYWCVLSLGRIA